MGVEVVCVCVSTYNNHPFFPLFQTQFIMTSYHDLFTDLLTISI